MESTTALRIGELSRRVGVNAHTLRAWESRYGLLRPTRTASGYRLYGPIDERRILAVLKARQEGVSVSVAVRRVLQDERSSLVEPTVLPVGPDGASSGHPIGVHAAYIQALQRAADRFDDAAAHAALDEAFATLALGDVVDDVILPFLQQLGRQWADGTGTVACEHFASQLVRRRLSALTLAWGSARGPAAVLACPSGEQHDIALLCFGLLLGRQDWRIHYLGADTPASDVQEVVDRVAPAVVVLAGTREEALAVALDNIGGVSVCIAGAGATGELAAASGAMLLSTRQQDAVAQLAQVLRRPAVGMRHRLER
ncbi:MerR family transcriptional regulator [Leekyejoonella antrihumi]|nr:MerR family transcriptional regulator [Leekyejoonella antrihumi]